MITGIGVVVLRVLVGLIFFYEGYHKLFSDPDAPRGRNGLATLIGRRGFPAPRLLGALVCLGEFAGGLLIVPGLLTRLVLIPLIVTVGLAAFVFKWAAGYAGGWDWPFAVFGMSVALFLIGSGSYSLDALFGLPLTT